MSWQTQDEPFAGAAKSANTALSYAAVPRWSQLPLQPWAVKGASPLRSFLTWDQHSSHVHCHHFRRCFWRCPCRQRETLSTSLSQQAAPLQQPTTTTSQRPFFGTMGLMNLHLSVSRPRPWLAHTLNSHRLLKSNYQNPVLLHSCSTPSPVSTTQTLPPPVPGVEKQAMNVHHMKTLMTSRRT